MKHSSSDVVNLFTGFCALVLVICFAIYTCCSREGRRESKRELEGEDGLPEGGAQGTARPTKKPRSPWCRVCQDFQCATTYGRCPHQ